MHEVLRRKTQAVCLNCCLFFAGSGFNANHLGEMTARVNTLA